MGTRGILISLEGCDGCGKSTQGALLCERLAAEGYPVGPSRAPGSVIREPGDTDVGEAIRRVLLHGSARPTPWTEALLYAAARAELVATVLLPELARGRVLVLDRFVDSSLAYQGCARSLGIDEVLAVNRPGLRGVMPDLTLVLDIDPAIALTRAGEAPDHIEAEGSELQRRVAAGYVELARRFPERIRSIDGSRDVATIAAEIQTLVLAALAGWSAER